MSREKKSTPSFVVELPIDVSDPGAQRQLFALFVAGGRLANVMIQHGREVVSAMRTDPRWATARMMPRKTKEQQAARKAVYAALRKDHQFSEYDFHKVVAAHKNAAGFKGRIGANVAQKLATRTFKAFEEYLYGARGLPRFKGRQRPLHSLEEKNHTTGIRWDAERQEVLVQGLRLPVLLPDLKRDEWLAFALEHKTKYCRLVWRQDGGIRRYAVQLIQEGRVPVKASVLERLAPEGTVGGLDMGPSAVAWVTEDDAGLEPLCGSVTMLWQAVRRLQRHIDRQRRAGNPENFNADGTVRKGRKTWTRSRRQAASEAQLSRLQGKLARHRANAHGQLTNSLISKARGWRDDGVSVRSLQRNYGRSVTMRAPGTFLSLLQRKAERADSARISQDARVLKTSQFDHTTGTCTKKPLSQRWHVFGDGRGRVQRDIYSAFLARNAVQQVDADGVLTWAHDCEVLEAAWQQIVPVLQSKGFYFAGEGCRTAPVRARSNEASSEVPTLVGAGSRKAPVELLA